VYGGVGALLTSTREVVSRWGEYFEDLLNPTDTPSNDEAESGRPPISGTEVAEGVVVDTPLQHRVDIISTPSAGTWRVHGSLPNWSTCVLWTREAAGMRISTSKSENMVLSRKRLECPLWVGNEILPQVEEFKYLGVLFKRERRMEREIDKRIVAASAVM